jgi:hypothetical protein
MQRQIETVSKRLEEIDRLVKVELHLKQFLSDIKKRQNSLEGEFVLTSNSHKKDLETIEAQNKVINEKRNTKLF